MGGFEIFSKYTTHILLLPFLWALTFYLSFFSKQLFFVFFFYVAAYIYNIYCMLMIVYMLQLFCLMWKTSCDFFFLLLYAIFSFFCFPLFSFTEIPWIRIFFCFELFWVLLFLINRKTNKRGGRTRRGDL